MDSGHNTNSWITYIYTRIWSQSEIPMKSDFTIDDKKLKSSRVFYGFALHSFSLFLGM